MVKISTSDFRKGVFINFKGEPHRIIEHKSTHLGRGSASVRVKLKSVKSGKVLTTNFKSGEMVEETPVDTKKMQYLYKDQQGFIFMDCISFEQFNVDKNIIGDFVKFIKEGETYQLFFYNDQVLGIKEPKNVKLKVTEAQEAIKGNTATAAKKTVTLETGHKLNVPLFIKQGEIIIVDSESGEYVARG